MKIPKIKLDKLKVSNSGVSQIMGTILLLAIAVVLFSAFMVYILSDPVTPSPPHANLAGSMEVTTAVIEHKGGESWKLDNSKIIVRLGNVEEVVVNFTNGEPSNSSISFIDENGNNRWDVGDSLEINCDNLFGRNTSDWQIEVMIIDLPSNSIIMDSILQPGVLHTMPPIADFTYSPAHPKVGKPITFNASRSYDPDGGNITKYEWDFNNNGTIDKIRYDYNTTWTYPQKGIYYVNLTVTDDEGQTGSITAGMATIPPINVTENKPPVANFTWIPLNPTTGEIIYFTDTSTDSDGSIVNWTWNFEDGTVLYEQNPSHQYSYNGTFTVTLTVKDDDEETNTTYQHISVNALPVANFTFEPGSPFTSDMVYFNSTSTDYDGTIDSWYWEFGDGTTNSSENTTHQYTDDGTYQVNLTVTDDGGATNTISKNVTVAEPNVPPTASFTYSGEYTFFDNPTGFGTVFCLSYVDGPNGDYTDCRGGLYVDDNYIWLSSHKTGLWRASKDDPSNYGDVTGGDDDLWDIWHSGSYIYGTGGSKHLYIYDDTSGEVVGDIATQQAEAYSVYATGDYAYVASDAGLEVYDVGTPSNLTYEGTLNTSLDFIKVRGSGNYIYATDYGNDEMLIYNISNPASPQHVATENFADPGWSGDIRGLFVDDGYVYVVNEDGDMYIVNVSNPAAPYVEGSIECNGTGTKKPGGEVFVIGNSAFVVAKNYIHWIDVSDKNNPKLVNTSYNSEFGFCAVYVYGCYVYAAAHDGLCIYCISDESGEQNPQDYLIRFNFSDNSTDPDGTIVSWEWEFGDGINSSQQNPTHTYTAAGTYTVNLTVTDNDGASNTTSEVVTVSNDPPTANFTWTPTDPVTNATIEFTDQSNDNDGIIVSWEWEFGDGINSSQQNPTHQYTNDGTYQINLTVTDNYGANDTISSSESLD